MGDLHQMPSEVKKALDNMSKRSNEIANLLVRRPSEDLTRAMRMRMERSMELASIQAAAFEKRRLR